MHWSKKWVGMTCTGVAFFLCFMFILDDAQAKYLVDQGEGYALCERLKSHLNKVIVFPRRGDKDGMRDLEFMKKVLAFHGFTMPPSKEIHLADIQGLIELMGEVDSLKFPRSSPYSGGDEGAKKYLEDRQSGRVPTEILESAKKYGRRYYKTLLDGNAVVRRIVDSHALAQQTLLQIEYFDLDGEINYILRHVDDTLNTPLPMNSDLDWPRPNNALVLWRNKYYVIFGDMYYFQITARTQNAMPQICKFWLKK